MRDIKVLVDRLPGGQARVGEDANGGYVMEGGAAQGTVITMIDALEAADPGFDAERAAVQVALQAAVDEPELFPGLIYRMQDPKARARARGALKA